MQVVLPIAFESPHDREPVGTKKAADLAAERAKTLQDAVVLTTAAVSPKHAHIDQNPLGLFVRAYIDISYSDVRTVFLKARTFNTMGEIGALMRFIEEQGRTSNPVTHVFIEAKQVDVRRLKIIVPMMFWKKNITCPFQINGHPLPMPWWAIPYELVAIPVNILRILRMREF
jgi:hypothetical protein